ncbi:hypothetical protein [Undibacterium sp. Tian12W]|uniref:hypothetical protein n=1 Tax=Undibacterium sp. Tian12W TaxID=3413054 RepID=UPI003BF3183E
MHDSLSVVFFCWILAKIILKHTLPAKSYASWLRLPTSILTWKIHHTPHGQIISLAYHNIPGETKMNSYTDNNAGNNASNKKINRRRPKKLSPPSIGLALLMLASTVHALIKLA